MTEQTTKRKPGRPARNPSAPISASAGKLQVRLPAELRDRFTERAQQLGLSEADAAREAIQKWVTPPTEDDTGHER
jgi:predicted HicB family RNase H-like nuclease